MVRVALWLIRLAGVVVVGALTFLDPGSEPAGLAVQCVTFALACLGILAWLPIGLWPTSSSPAVRQARRMLPYSLGLVTVAASLGATAGGSGTSVIALGALALLTAASDLSLATAIAIAALGMLALEIGGLLFSQGLGTLLGLPALLFTEVMVGRYRAAYRIQAEQARALLEQHERLRAEQRRADVLDERARIAREIHDVLAHSLGALSIQIQAARALLTDYGDIDRAIGTLTTAQRMAADGLTETRRAVHALRTDMRPLHEELAASATEHAARHRVLVRCETDGEPCPLPAEATVALVRTAQESLVNAAKHAPGQPIDMRLRYDEHDIRMTITNDLTPDAEAAPEGASALQTVDGGYGLTGMRERLRLLRGTLVAGPSGKRWVVTAELPHDRTPPTRTEALHNAAPPPPTRIEQTAASPRIQRDAR